MAVLKVQIKAVVVVYRSLVTGIKENSEKKVSFKLNSPWD